MQDNENRANVHCHQKPNENQLDFFYIISILLWCPNLVHIQTNASRLVHLL